MLVIMGEACKDIGRFTSGGKSCQNSTVPYVGHMLNVTDLRLSIHAGESTHLIFNPLSFLL